MACWSDGGRVVANVTSPVWSYESEVAAGDADDGDDRVGFGQRFRWQVQAEVSGRYSWADPTRLYSWG
jgi:hypothetical protein